MPPAQAASSGTAQAYAKTVGTEPLPGYTLLEPLGRGGFGEVWKCEAPGGLHKAIKFVAGDPDAAGGGDQLRQEAGAFEAIKRIRHPFLLTLERVEMVAGELVMVMELADQQLADCFAESRSRGLPGIPRGELLNYLADAAEALDVLSTKYGLQHLDVKPANLFVMDGHVKVGDYGLVTRAAAVDPSDGNRGLTPRYVAPEVLMGKIDPRSDQYSLALVYQELLTGTFPYSAKNPSLMMMQHAAGIPDLSGLPEADRPVVGKALSKKPDDRFPSCLAFTRALMAADALAAAADPALALRTARLDRAPADPTGRFGTPTPAPALRTAHPNDSTVTGNTPRTPFTTPSGTFSSPSGSLTAVSRPSLTVPGSRTLPSLVTAARPKLVAPPPPPPPPPAAEDMAYAEDVVSPGLVLDPIRPVVPVARLEGGGSPDDFAPSLADFLTAVVAAAAKGGHVPRMSGDLARLADGTWVSRFPSTVPVSVAPIKLSVVKERWGLVVEQPDPTRIVLRRPAPATGGLWGSFTGKKVASGLEVVVQLPPSARGIGEVEAAGRVYGTPDAAFAKSALETLPRLIEDVQRELGNVDDRRREARVRADLPVRLYPIHGDGAVEEQMFGTCRDISASGLCVVTPTRLPSAHAFVVFDGIQAISHAAALVKFVRSQPTGREVVSAGPFRGDI